MVFQYMKVSQSDMTLCIIMKGCTQIDMVSYNTKGTPGISLPQPYISFPRNFGFIVVFGQA